MLFAAIFVPNFILQSLLATQPDERDQPTAVVDGKPPLLKVVALNKKAQKAGVEIGDTKIQAEIAGVNVLLRSPDLEYIAHKSLISCAYNFSPRVQIKANDLVVLDIEGLRGLFGTPDQIAKKVHDALKQHRLKTNVVVAPNPDSATIAARGFRGVTILTDSQQLASLPVILLNPSTDILETTELWGIRTVGDLAALDAVALSERFGKDGITLQQLARGQQVTPFVSEDAALEFAEHAELDYAIELLEPLLSVISSLLERMCAALREHSLATNEIQLKLTLNATGIDDEQSPEKETFHCRGIKLPNPTSDSTLLLRLFELDLQSHPSKAPVIKVFIQAEAVHPRYVQQELFAPETPDPDRLELTLASLSNLVGPGQVGSPELLDSHRPRAYVMAQFVPSRGPNRPLSDSGSPKVALRIFEPPKKAAIRVRSNVPHEVLFDGKRGEVIQHSGPWISNGEWWADMEWRRKEWDVQLQFPDGAIQDYRIFIDLGTKQGFIEGSYD